MKHYPHHIGDFDRATRHLTRLERSIYRDLLDLYYDTEKPLTLDMPALCRRILANSNEESTAVEQTLNEFFTKTPTGWFNCRCEAEIAAYRANNSQKAEAGRASAAAKRARLEQALNGRSTDVQQPFNGRSTALQLTKNQEPVTNKELSKDNSSSATPPTVSEIPKIPDCPHAKLIALFCQRLPELPAPKVELWDGTSAKNMRARWRWLLTAKKASGARYATDEESAIAWMDRFFSYVSQSDFLMGRVGGFQCSLQWLMNAGNFAKVLQGNYDNRAAA